MITNDLYKIILSKVMDECYKVKFIKTDEKLPAFIDEVNPAADFTTDEDNPNVLNYKHTFKTDDINNTQVIQFINKNGDVLINNELKDPIIDVEGGEDTLKLTLTLTEVINV